MVFLKIIQLATSIAGDDQRSGGLACIFNHKPTLATLQKPSSLRGRIHGAAWFAQAQPRCFIRINPFQRWLKNDFAVNDFAYSLLFHFSPSLSLFHVTPESRSAQKDCSPHC